MRRVPNSVLGYRIEHPGEGGFRLIDTIQELAIRAETSKAAAQMLRASVFKLVAAQPWRDRLIYLVDSILSKHEVTK